MHSGEWAHSRRGSQGDEGGAAQVGGRPPGESLLARARGQHASAPRVFQGDVTPFW